MKNNHHTIISAEGDETEFWLQASQTSYEVPRRKAANQKIRLPCHHLIQAMLLIMAL